MIKAVIFDMGGVITSQAIFNHEFNKAIEKVFGEKNVEFSNPKFKFLFDSFIKLETDEITDIQFWKNFANKLNKPYNPSFEKVFIKIARKLKPRQEMVKIIKKLKNSRIKTAVLSNVWTSFAKHNYDLGYYGIFDHVFLSHELKMRKPDKEIFYYVLEKLSIKPEEVIFIDDMRHNVLAANEVGIYGLLYTNTSMLVKELRKLGLKF
nr:HAD family phosphatase [Candidatus Levybacteria bacterium]